MFRTLQFTCGLLLLLSPRLMVAAAESSSVTKTTQANDLFCGPRCVWKLLKVFGIETRLDKVITDMGMEDSQQGASVSQLLQSLESHGLRTSAIRTSAVFELDWDLPFIAHARKAGGHFVICYPVDAQGRRAIWDGYARSLTQAEFERDYQPSGVILLVSQEAINLEALNFTGFRHLSACVLGLLGLLGFVFVCVFWRRAFC